MFISIVFCISESLRLYDCKRSMIATDISINAVEKHGCSKEISMNQSVQAKNK